MNKSVIIIGIISLVLMLAGAIMKSFYIPNQLIILGAGLSWIKIGMNSPNAPNNYKLLLNIIR
jgi:hypothetical protein